MKPNIVISDFSRGEISEQFEGRTDQQIYYQGAKLIENFYTKPIGPAKHCQGTKYLSYNSTAAHENVRLIPYEYEGVQYVIYFTQSQIQIIKAEATMAPVDDIVSPYDKAHLHALKFQRVENLIYVVHPEYEPKKIDFDGVNLSIASAGFVDTGAPIFTTADNRPSAICYHEGRIIVAGTYNNKQTVWASKTGTVTDFTVGTGASDAWIAALAVGQNSRILWLLSTENLIIGSAEGIIRGYGASLGMIPGQTIFKTQNSIGSADIQGKLISGTIIYVEKNGRKISAMSFSTEYASYRPTNLTQYAEHITSPGIQDFVYQQTPDPIIWILLTSGVLIICAFDPQIGTLAFSRRTTQHGTFSGIAVVEGSEEQVVFVIGKRELDIGNVQYVEYMSKKEIETQLETYFVDCGVSESGVDIVEVTGLARFEGMTVHVTVDGGSHPTRVVSGGKIELQDAVKGSVVTVGLYNEAKLDTMKLDIPGALTQGRARTITKVLTRMYKTLGGKIGQEEDDLLTIAYRDTTDDISLPPGWVTGDNELALPGGFDTSTRLHIRQQEPLAMTILAIYLQVTFGG